MTFHEQLAMRRAAAHAYLTGVTVGFLMGVFLTTLLGYLIWHPQKFYETPEPVEAPASHSFRMP